jgi:hypothetical protein
VTRHAADRGPIPTAFHAVADYVVVAVLVLAPRLFSFADETASGRWIAILAAAGLLALNATTNYEGGILARVVPMRAHLVADGAIGLFVAASPWLLGFGERGTEAWLPFAIIGLGGVGCAALTEKLAPPIRSEDDGTPRAPRVGDAINKPGVRPDTRSPGGHAPISRRRPGNKRGGVR